MRVSLRIGVEVVRRRSMQGMDHDELELHDGYDERARTPTGRSDKYFFVTQLHSALKITRE